MIKKERRDFVFCFLKNFKKERGKLMNKKVMAKNGVFVLGQRVVGSPYYSSVIQSQAGKKVKPAGVVKRHTDPNKSLLVALKGQYDREEYVPLCLFNQHPPAEVLQTQALTI